jgi:hypothetical protein
VIDRLGKLSADAACAKTTAAIAAITDLIIVSPVMPSYQGHQDSIPQNARYKRQLNAN